MKLKQLPDDFFVEEVTSVRPGVGVFAWYALEKRGWTTPEALGVIRRRWRIDHRRLSYGGLKDRHAHTIQYFSIFRGPARNLSQQGIDVRHLGYIDEPYTSHHIDANRFQLVLRNISPDREDEFGEQLAEVREIGLPNYFDDQRFGSVAGHGQFLAKALMAGDFETALKLALTAPYPHDRSGQKKEKAKLRARWGQWPELKAELEKGHARSLVDYLVHHPTDFKGAVERLRPELRGLYLSAYQSHLWNRMLAGWLLASLAPEQLTRVRLQLGSVPMPKTLSAEQQKMLEAMELPLPSAKIEWQEGDPRREWFDKVLAEEDVTVESFRLKGLKSMFFSKGERHAWCRPGDLSLTWQHDELHPGTNKGLLHFTLPRGSYATLIVKRISDPG